MTCETVRPLLSEFQDDQLDAATAWQVQTHLTDCEACARVSRDLRSVSRMLSALPNRQPSANFEASLAQRLALTRRPQTHPEPQPTLRDRLRQAFPGPRLRPALALGVAMTAAVAVLLVPAAPPPDSGTLAAVRTVDPAFVADCVAQHRRDAAGEPLADVAAQNLAGRLDGTPSATPAPGADPGLF